MPLVVVWIGIAVSILIRYIIVKIMLLVGLAFISYIGIDTLVDNFEVQIMSNYSAMPSIIWQVATLTGLDVAITIMLSALVLVLQIKLLKAGTKMLVRIGLT